MSQKYSLSLSKVSLQSLVPLEMKIAYPLQSATTQVMDFCLVSGDSMDHRHHIASGISTSHGPQHGLWGRGHRHPYVTLCCLLVCLFFPKETQPLAHQGTMYKTVRTDALKPLHSKAQDSHCITSKTSHRPAGTQEKGNKPHLCMGLPHHRSRAG